MYEVPRLLVVTESQWVCTILWLVFRTKVSHIHMNIMKHINMYTQTYILTQLHSYAPMNTTGPCDPDLHVMMQSNPR